MKANPKKLGGRKGDRMTPDWLSGYVIEELTYQQVVLRNTNSNKVLKSMSLMHIKPFRERCGVDMSNCGDKVGADGNEVINACHEDDNLTENGSVSSQDVAGIKVVGDEVADDKVTGDGVEEDEVTAGETAGNKVLGDQIEGGSVAGDEIEGGEVAGTKIVDDEVAEDM